MSDFPSSQGDYLIWCPDCGQTAEDGRTIEAGGPHTAVEEWAMRSDYTSAEYSIVGGSDAEVMVRYPDGLEERFVVSGESVPSYQARAVKTSEET